MSSLDRIAEQFDVTPSPRDCVPVPIEDSETRPEWLQERRPRELSKRDRVHLRQLIAVTQSGDVRPGAIARALRNVLKHFAEPADLRVAALEFLQSEAVRLDAAGR